MASAPKKPSAILVIRDRNTVKLPPVQLGSFPKLFEADEYEGKETFNARIHLNPPALTAMEATLQAKCIDAHFPTMKAQVEEQAAALKADGKSPILKIVASADLCQSPKEWLEDKLKDPNAKDKVQLPTLKLSVPALLPLRKGQDVAERRTVKFWNAKGGLMDEPEKTLAKMTAGTWLQPVVHANLVLSKQVGPAPRCSLQLVGFQIITLVEWGQGGAPVQSASDDDEMRRIMGADYSPADDLANLGVGPATVLDAESGLEDDSPF